MGGATETGLVSLAVGGATETALAVGGATETGLVSLAVGGATETGLVSLAVGGATETGLVSCDGLAVGGGTGMGLVSCDSLAVDTTFGSSTDGFAVTGFVSGIDTTSSVSTAPLEAVWTTASGFCGEGEVSFNMCVVTYLPLTPFH